MESILSEGQIIQWNLAKRKRLNSDALLSIMYYEYAWSIVLMNPNRNHINKVLYPAHLVALPKIPANLKLVNQLHQAFGTDLLPRMHDKIQINSRIEYYMNLVYQIYSYLPAHKLIKLIHSEKPWIESRKGMQSYDVDPKKIINNQLLYDFYSKKLNPRNRKENNLR